MHSMLQWLAFVLVTAGAVSAQQSAKIDLRCTASVCDNWLSKNQCPELDDDCVANGRVFSYPIECGCCDYCVSYLPIGDWCDIGTPGQPTASKVCGAGLKCMRDADEDHATCKRMRSDCHAAQDGYDGSKEKGTLGHLQLRPVCDERGQFAPAQCIPGSICYCVSPTGKRIFGEQPFSSPELVTSMKCACSRSVFGVITDYHAIRTIFVEIALKWWNLSATVKLLV
jgi:Thyroglobulin type-1 repeat